MTTVNIDKALCLMLEGKAVSDEERNAVATHVKARLMNGEQGDDLPIAMKALGCDYNAACEAIIAEDKDGGLSLLETAMANPLPRKPPNDARINVNLELGRVRHYRP